eukprot:gb/GECG01000858.1/.p1 GENE.gb/GECG01000858.1/~~gb/GECG01000858.1/.p1  ORF type:complete len:290 (+),score=46.74 gb/GECG01000858.1/:1-870(+)
MAFSSRAKKYRQDDGSASSATGSVGGTPSYEDLRQIEQQDALKRMAHTLKPLRTQLQSIASKVETLGQGHQDTMDLRRTLNQEMEEYEGELKKADTMMKILRSRSDMAPIKLQKLEKMFDKCQSTYWAQKKLANTREQQYNPSDDDGSYKHQTKGPMSQDVRGGIQQQLQSERTDQSGHTETIVELKGFNEVDSRIVEERNREATKLVQQTKELNAAYQDLATLVGEQSEQLDNVEQNTTEANDAVKSGNENLESAIEYQAKARKKMFIACLIIVVIAGVILVPTLVHS